MPSREHLTDEEIATLAVSTELVSHREAMCIIRSLAQEVKELRAFLPYTNGEGDSLCDVVLDRFDTRMVDAMVTICYILPNATIHNLKDVCEKAMAGGKPIIAKCMNLAVATRWRNDFQKLGLHLEIKPPSRTKI